MAPMRVLSIQSRVASGYVGNSAAVPCLQCLGIDAIAIDTAVLSNHPAHGAFRGGARPPGEVAALIEGVARHCGPSTIRAVLSGYLGDPASGAIVLDTVAAVKAAAPGALYCLDPVMGDDGRIYVAPPLVRFFRETALPVADLIVPNAFEAGLLLGEPTVEAKDARSALERLRRIGTDRVVITGIRHRDERIVSAAADSAGAWSVSVPRVTAPSWGAGDAFTAILLARLMANKDDLAASLGQAAAAVHAILTATRRSGTADLDLVSALDAVRNPPEAFAVERLI